ncbi:MAG: sulfate ABC transporter permease subunit CysT [Verrucomicrobia bacterium]|nr:sulfate ABC transporter permease subunit CysT [Verrucomicrobiota bacterium]
MISGNKRAQPNRRILPGFGLSMGFAVTYLGLLVLIPLAGVFIRASGMTWQEFWTVVTSPQVVATYKITFGVSLAAAATNAVFGLIVAWSLVRYTFPGKRVLDAIVDLPFALPTAVAGIALTAIYAETGIMGRWFYALGIETAFSRVGIYIALTFIGIPFVVRSLQPVLEDLDPEFEEAAASLGASRLRAFTHVILPGLLPALLTGFALAYARAIGEYGSVIFISGNMPFETEISPLIIVKFLEQFQIAQATAVAAVMLVASFVLLLGVNILQRWTESIGRART